MATYVIEKTRGRTLHLLKLEKTFPNDTQVYLDATKLIKEAQKSDKQRGFETNGPEVGQVVESAREYADYVAQHATIDNLHQFNCRGYMLFTSQNFPAARGKTTVGGQKPVKVKDVRSNVSA